MEEGVCIIFSQRAYEASDVLLDEVGRMMAATLLVKKLSAVRDPQNTLKLISKDTDLRQVPPLLDFKKNIYIYTKYLVTAKHSQSVIIGHFVKKDILMHIPVNTLENGLHIDSILFLVAFFVYQSSYLAPNEQDDRC